ncbi:hypothetical protein BP6252_13216 [Coleophoma cylindrospora]|uniref:Uncharacterized protein n=1 Tax=Coleophoma cylindrospora TaxID=1849047 RepID=A0A3D8QAS0_9HELO|nr:hypothetical protein BP6252_13216 [Coleophoma cylindrospora]
MDRFLYAVNYAPIALFAESRRVQQALVSTIMTNNNISPALTGCIKDAGWLWELNASDILGQPEDTVPFVVSSVRHGNSFPLANKAMLTWLELIGAKHPVSSRAVTGGARETTVNVSFISPAVTSTANRRWDRLLCMAISTFVTGSTCLLCLLPAVNGYWIGTGLIACVSLSQLLLAVLRQLISPVFANMKALDSDQRLRVPGGAALDVHVIATNWNSSKLDVLCGYSSQVHSFTNLPVRVNRPVLLRWSARVLALVLTTQAALLACLTNINPEEKWSSLLWLGTYIVLYLVARIMNYLHNPRLYTMQPGTEGSSQSFTFSGRIAALIFIAMLPVSHRANRWSWWDGFMPNNERRQELQRQLESSNSFNNPADLEWDQSPQQVEQENIPLITKEMIKETTTAYNRPAFKSRLLSYKESMGFSTNYRGPLKEEV